MIDALIHGYDFVDLQIESHDGLYHSSHPINDQSVMTMTLEIVNSSNHFNLYFSCKSYSAGNDRRL